MQRCARISCEIVGLTPAAVKIRIPSTTSGLSHIYWIAKVNICNWQDTLDNHDYDLERYGEEAAINSEVELHILTWVCDNDGIDYDDDENEIVEY